MSHSWFTKSVCWVTDNSVLIFGIDRAGRSSSSSYALAWPCESTLNIKVNVWSQSMNMLEELIGIFQKRWLEIMHRRNCCFCNMALTFQTTVFFPWWDRKLRGLPAKDAAMKLFENVFKHLATREELQLAKKQLQRMYGPSFSACYAFQICGRHNMSSNQHSLGLQRRKHNLFLDHVIMYHLCQYYRAMHHLEILNS